MKRRAAATGSSAAAARSTRSQQFECQTKRPRQDGASHSVASSQSSASCSQKPSLIAWSCHECTFRHSVPGNRCVMCNALRTASRQEMHDFVLGKPVRSRHEGNVVNLLEDDADGNGTKGNAPSTNAGPAQQQQQQPRSKPARTNPYLKPTSSSKLRTNTSTNTGASKGANTGAHSKTSPDKSSTTRSLHDAINLTMAREALGMAAACDSQANPSAVQTNTGQTSGIAAGAAATATNTAESASDQHNHDASASTSVHAPDQPLRRVRTMGSYRPSWVSASAALPAKRPPSQSRTPFARNPYASKAKKPPPSSSDKKPAATKRVAPPLPSQSLNMAMFAAGKSPDRPRGSAVTATTPTPVATAAPTNPFQRFQSSSVHRQSSATAPATAHPSKTVDSKTPKALSTTTNDNNSIAKNGKPAAKPKPRPKRVPDSPTKRHRVAMLNVISKLPTEQGAIPYDPATINTWVYPKHDDFPVRDYQLELAETALWSNTLVSLPTGLGKTLIAAVVLYNFHRWFPTGTVVFLAPTVPLVAQQAQACSKILGLSLNDTAVVTGKSSPAERSRWYQTKRILYGTPQTLANDLASGICSPKRIVCLVLDEVHKARGDYAYMKVVHSLRDGESNFRLVGLSATPGTSIKAIQEIIDRLHVAQLAARTEDDPSVEKYVHQRHIEVVIVEPNALQSEIDRIINMDLIGPILANLRRFGALPKSMDIVALSPNALFRFMEQYKKRPSSNNGMIHNFLTLQKLVSLRGSARQSIGLVRQKMMEYNQLAHSKGKASSKLGSLKKIILSDEWKQLWDKILSASAAATSTEASTSTNGRFQSPVKARILQSPKLKKLVDLLREHFARSRAVGKEASTRAIVFSHSRDSVGEITKVLRNLDDVNLRPRHFVGQSEAGTAASSSSSTTNDTSAVGGPSTAKLQTYRPSYATGMVKAKPPPRSAQGAAMGQLTISGTPLRGMKQAEQQQALAEFRRGTFNVLVCTCIGEEGLDIGDVDLTINYDILRSPIRSIQRNGRTGRKRDGRVISLIAKGLEETTYHKQINDQKRLSRALQQPAKFKMVIPKANVLPLNPLPKRIDLQVSIPESYPLSQVAGIGKTSSRGKSGGGGGVGDGNAGSRRHRRRPWKLDEDTQLRRRFLLGITQRQEEDNPLPDPASMFPDPLRRHFLRISTAMGNADSKTDCNLDNRGAAKMPTRGSSMIALQAVIACNFVDAGLGDQAAASTKSRRSHGRVSGRPRISHRGAEEWLSTFPCHDIESADKLNEANKLAAFSASTTQTEQDLTPADATSKLTAATKVRMINQPPSNARPEQAHRTSHQTDHEANKSQHRQQHRQHNQTASASDSARDGPVLNAHVNDSSTTTTAHEIGQHQTQKESVTSAPIQAKEVRQVQVQVQETAQNTTRAQGQSSDKPAEDKRPDPPDEGLSQSGYAEFDYADEISDPVIPVVNHDTGLQSRRENSAGAGPGHDNGVRDGTHKCPGIGDGGGDGAGVEQQHGVVPTSIEQPRTEQVPALEPEGRLSILRSEDIPNTSEASPLNQAESNEDAEVPSNQHDVDEMNIDEGMMGIYFDAPVASSSSSSSDGEDEDSYNDENGFINHNASFGIDGEGAINGGKDGGPPQNIQLPIEESPSQTDGIVLSIAANQPTEMSPLSPAPPPPTTAIVATTAQSDAGGIDDSNGTMIEQGADKAQHEKEEKKVSNQVPPTMQNDTVYEDANDLSQPDFPLIELREKLAKHKPTPKQLQQKRQKQRDEEKGQSASARTNLRLLRSSPVQSEDEETLMSLVSPKRAKADYDPPIISLLSHGPNKKDIKRKDPPDSFEDSPTTVVHNPTTTALAEERSIARDDNAENGGIDDCGDIDGNNCASISHPNAAASIGSGNINNNNSSNNSKSPPESPSPFTTQADPGKPPLVPNGIVGKPKSTVGLQANENLGSPSQHQSQHQSLSPAPFNPSPSQDSGIVVVRRPAKRRMVIDETPDKTNDCQSSMSIFATPTKSPSRRSHPAASQLLLDTQISDAKQTPSDDVVSQLGSPQHPSSMGPSQFLLDTPPRIFPQNRQAHAPSTMTSLDIDDICCAVCFEKTSTDSDPIVLCDGTCNLGFHMSCYNDKADVSSDEIWKCAECSYKPSSPGSSELLCASCKLSTGPMKRSMNGMWRHTTCNTWRCIDPTTKCVLCSEYDATQCHSCKVAAHPHCALHDASRGCWSLVRVQTDSAENVQNNKSHPLDMTTMEHAPVAAVAMFCPKHVTNVDAFIATRMDCHPNEEMPTISILQTIQKQEPSNRRDGGNSAKSSSGESGTDGTKERSKLKKLRKTKSIDPKTTASNGGDRKCKETLGVRFNDDNGGETNHDDDDDDDGGGSEEEAKLQRRRKRQAAIARFVDQEAGVDGADDFDGDTDEEEEARRLEDDEASHDSFINDNAHLTQHFSQDNALDAIDPDCIERHDGNVMNNHRKLDIEMQRQQLFSTPILNRRMRRDEETPPSTSNSQAGLGRMHFIRSVINHHKNGGEAEEIESMFHHLQDTPGETPCSIDENSISQSGTH